MPYATLQQLPPAVRKRSKAYQQAFRSAFNAAFAKSRDEGAAMRIAYAAAAKADRKTIGDRAASPIVTVEDLRDAIAAFGGAHDKADARRHIIRRARALGATRLLPESWRSDTAAAYTHSEIRTLLQGALRRKHTDELGNVRYPYVRDVADAFVIYELESRLYKAPYTISSKGAIVVKDGAEVLERMAYEPIIKADR